LLILGSTNKLSILNVFSSSWSEKGVADMITMVEAEEVGVNTSSGRVRRLLYCSLDLFG
jgi:hypothetical protein